MPCYRKDSFDNGSVRNTRKNVLNNFRHYENCQNQVKVLYQFALLFCISINIFVLIFNYFDLF